MARYRIKMNVKKWLTIFLIFVGLIIGIGNFSNDYDDNQNVVKVTITATIAVPEIITHPEPVVPVETRTPDSIEVDLEREVVNTRVPQPHPRPPESEENN